MVLEIAVVESLFLALNETRDGCFNTSCGIKIVVPFFTTRLFNVEEWKLLVLLFHFPVCCFHSMEYGFQVVVIAVIVFCFSKALSTLCLRKLLASTAFTNSSSFVA